MNKRRGGILAAILCCAMVFSLTACNKEKEPEASSSEPEQETSSWENPLTTPRPESSYKPELPDVGERLQAAIAQNSDTVGWLSIPGTEVDEAVVQSTDNKFYYRRDNLGNSSFSGSLWMDYECDIGDGDAAGFSRNTIIYGHNLGKPQGVRDDPNGVKFAQLFKFDDLDFARAHPYFYFTTAKGSFIYEIFTVFYSEDKLSPVPYHYADFSDTDYEKLLEDVRARSQFDYNVEVSTDDKIMTLSTCTYKYGTYTQNPHQRFVVMGRLTGAGESYYEEADLQINPDPKAPQFKK